MLRPRALPLAQMEVARKLGLSVRRARAYWNNEVNSVRAEEADRIRAYRRVLLEERHRRLDGEMQALKIRLSQLE